MHHTFGLKNEGNGKNDIDKSLNRNVTDGGITNLLKIVFLFLKAMYFIKKKIYLAKKEEE